MKVQIPTPKYTIIEELSKPVPSHPLVTETKSSNGIVVSYIGQKIGEVICHTSYSEKVWYCKNCGCEPYGVYPCPSYILLSDVELMNKWNWDSPAMEAAAGLQPYYERRKKVWEFDRVVERDKAVVPVCPVCGGELIEHFWVDHGNTKNMELKEIFDKYKEYIASYDKPITVGAPTKEANLIKSDISKVQEFLSTIISIEKNIQAVKDRLLFLYIFSPEINRHAKFAQLYPTMLAKQAVDDECNILENEKQTIMSRIAELNKQNNILNTQNVKIPDVKLPEKPILPVKPVYAKPNIFNKKKITAENQEKEHKYNEDVKLYQIALQKYSEQVELARNQQSELYEQAKMARKNHIQLIKEEIAEKNDKLIELNGEIDAKKSILASEIEKLQSKTDYPEVQLKTDMDNEITSVEELLANLYKQRNRLYNSGVVFGKYCDFIAVTSFYEYLISGRCAALDGVNGCYNLYESELRANLIINKLDIITNSLDQIKNNQYYLYSQLSQINTEVNALNVTTAALYSGVSEAAEKILEQNAVIAYNSAAAAFYAKINAEMASADQYISIICL